MIYVFLAEGFEEVEAVTPIDMLRRCGKNVVTVGVNDNIIVSSHGLPVVTDTVSQEVVINNDVEMIIFPGGMPGTINLEKNSVVQSAIDYCVKNNKFIAAICAAPSILGHKGLLDGKNATCYTGFETQLGTASVSDAPVVRDGNIITARGAGVALEFSFALVKALFSEERCKKLKDSILSV